MEFRFNVSDIFKEPIVEIDSNLLPPGFSGDRRAMWDAITRTTEVVNAMGEASARAQGLTKPITTAERLRNTEQQKVYLLVDREAKNGKGIVTGMLKTGHKGLYVFDRDGHHYQCTPPCVLDFYVHESRQRSGLGKQIFEHMLQREKIEPVKIAIDRPSDKFLGFLNKHYRLNSPIKQMNNFVVFDGFFPDSQTTDMNGENQSGSPGKVGAASAKTIANGLQNYASPLGRYGAPRPPCSMGQIIHNQSPTVAQVQESASSPGRLNQNPSYYSPPLPPRQAYSSYETNVNSGVPNEIQMTDFNKQMQYTYGDVQQQVQKSENGGFLPQNYQYALSQQQQPQQQQQQIYKVQTPNLQQQYYQPSVCGLPQQILQGSIQNIPQQQIPSNIQNVGSQQLQPQLIQQQQPTVHLQPNPQYIQQQIPQQQVSAPYHQQQPQQQQISNISPVVPTQSHVAYQQQMQPQVAASAPHLQTAQHPQQQHIPSISPQTHVAYSHLQPQIATSSPQLNAPHQQQILNNQPQFYSPPPQPAMNVTSVPNIQPAPMSYQSPTAMQTNPQSVSYSQSPQEFVAHNQNTQAQIPSLAVESANDHILHNIQTASQNTQQGQMTPQHAAQTLPQQMYTTPATLTQNNTSDMYHAPQAGDAAQNTTEQKRKCQYYGSSSNEMRLYPSANVEPEGFTKKPSSSGEPEKSQEEQAHPSPKLERPRSLSIQISVDETGKKEDEDGAKTDSKVQEELDENADEKKDEIKEVEIKMENLDVKVVRKAPDATDTDGTSVGRKTPHLTDQGFFDLKFYHNKLW